MDSSELSQRLYAISTAITGLQVDTARAQERTAAHTSAIEVVHKRIESARIRSDRTLEALQAIQLQISGLQKSTQSLCEKVRNLEASRLPKIEVILPLLVLLAAVAFKIVSPEQAAGLMPK